MRRLLVLVVAGATMMGFSTSASASFCLEPRAPSAMFVRKPTKPYCAASRSCSEWDVNSYKAEVKRYYDQLEEYAASVTTFHKNAVEYVECMANLD
jgi:hypothetical protein